MADGAGAQRRRAAVVLAAGQGTRMRSRTPKVLHRVAGRTLLDRALDAAEGLGCERVVVVVGAHSPAVGAHAEARLGAGSTALQDPPLGTGHAVLAAREALAGFDGDLLVTYADVPLQTAADLQPLFALREAGADLAVLGFEAAGEHAYGRLIRDEAGALQRIVEHKDATAQERACTLCNSGVLVADAATLFGLLDQVTPANAQGELYLTDVVGLGRAAGLTAQVAVVPEAAVMGVNSQAELAVAEAEWQRAARLRALTAGVTMPAPDTVHLSHDTDLTPGVTVEPYVVFGPGVRVEAGATVHSFSHLEGCIVRAEADVGPFARLRPKADIGPKARVGNFVEVKAVTMGAGAKANHLAYLGDGEVGAGANIGAGTIFCNYDGFNKARTVVGEGAFVGSNSALVAPVTIARGAYVGSGSVVTRDVSPDALALVRAPQVEKPGWAARFRERMRLAKAAPGK